MEESKKNNRHVTRWLVGLATCLLVPSLAQVQKYLGTAGCAAYLLVGFIVIFCGYRYFLSRFLSAVTERKALWLAAATFLLLALVFAIVYPIANSGLVGGGSDREDNINVATIAMVNGHYPYYARGYTGAPSDLLPGGLVLGIPFVLLGNSAYQNLWWLGGFFVVAKVILKTWRFALLLLWAVLGLSVAVQQEFVTGGDLITNSVYVLTFIFLMVRWGGNPSTKTWKKITAAVFLGIGLSSRANFLLLLPLIFGELIERTGWKAAVAYGTLACAVAAGITIPFYIYDRDGFVPLNTIEHLSQFEDILPFARIILPLCGGLLAVGLACLRRSSGRHEYLGKSACVQAFIVLSPCVLSIIVARRLDFTYTGYGHFFLFFGVLAFGARLCEAIGEKSLASNLRVM